MRPPYMPPQTCESCGVGLDPRVLATKPTAVSGPDGYGYHVWCYACVKAAQMAAEATAWPAWDEEHGR